MFRRAFSVFALALAAAAVLVVPAQADLTLTAAGTSLGFTLSKFATGFGRSGSGCCGPLGMAVAPDGNVIVDNSFNSTNYVFADVDGQSAGLNVAPATFITSNSFNAFPPAMATSNGAVWTSGGFSGPNANHLIKLNNDGSTNTVYNIAGLNITNGMWTNPANGHIIATGGGQIYDIDVSGAVPTFRVIVNASPDGITVSPDGTTVYGNGGQGYDIATGALVFNHSPACNGPDGMGVITSSNALNGDIIFNCNDGTVVLMDHLTGVSTVIANGGTRGDFTTPDGSNGSLLLSQTNDVFRLGCGAGCVVGGPPPAVPEPASFLMFGSGVLGLAGMLRKKLRK